MENRGSQVYKSPSKGVQGAPGRGRGAQRDRGYRAENSGTREGRRAEPGPSVHGRFAQIIALTPPGRPSTGPAIWGYHGPLTIGSYSPLRQGAGALPNLPHLRKKRAEAPAFINRSKNGFGLEFLGLSWRCNGDRRPRALTEVRRSEELVAHCLTSARDCHESAF